MVDEVRRLFYGGRAVTQQRNPWVIALLSAYAKAKKGLKWTQWG